MSSAILLLDGVVAGIASASHYTHPMLSPGGMTPRPINTHTIEGFFVDPNTVVTGIIFRLETSLDSRDIPDGSASWHTLGEYEFTSEEITAKKAIAHLVNRPAIRVRLKLIEFENADASAFFSGRYLEGSQ